MDSRKIILLVLMILAGMCQSVRAKETSGQPPEKDSWTLSVFFENDLFSDTDQHYTNGIKISFISQDLTEFANSTTLPEWSKPVVQRLPFVNDRKIGLSSEKVRNIVLSLGQEMYTPEDISRTDLIVDDQPYAGWAYLGAAFHTKTTRKLDSFEIQLGMVGPSSFAEQTQNFVHETRRIATAKGWKNQLNDEVGLNLIYERRWRLWNYDDDDLFGVNQGVGGDFLVNYGGVLGNVSTYVNGGAEFRAGWNMPADFGDSLLRPAGESSAPLHGHDSRLRKGYGGYLFALLNSRIVLRNIFFDGNTFTSSHSVDKNNYITDLGIGVCLLMPLVKISYARVWRGKEFKGQDSHHQFGSITFSFSW